VRAEEEWVIPGIAGLYETRAGVRLLCGAHSEKLTGRLQILSVPRHVSRSKLGICFGQVSVFVKCVRADMLMRQQKYNEYSKAIM
jgi:hypothetical protein